MLHQKKSTAQAKGFVPINITVMGDEAVGKSDLLINYIQNTSGLSAGKTVGGAYYARRLKRHGRQVCLQIRDLSGQASYRSVAVVMAKNSDIFLLMFDLTKRESFNNMEHYISLMRQVASQSQLIFVATKADRVGHFVVTDEDIKQLEKKYAARCFKTSSLIEGQGIRDALDYAIDLHEQRLREQQSGYKIKQFFLRHWGKIAIISLVVAATVVLGVVTGGALPAITALMVTIGIGVAPLAMMVGLVLVGGVGLFAGMALGVAVCAGVEALLKVAKQDKVLAAPVLKSSTSRVAAKAGWQPEAPAVEVLPVLEEVPGVAGEALVSAPMSVVEVDAVKGDLQSEMVLPKRYNVNF